MIQAEGSVTVSIEADSKGMHIGSQLRNIKKIKNKTDIAQKMFPQQQVEACITHIPSEHF